MLGVRWLSPPSQRWCTGPKGPLCRGGGVNPDESGLRWKLASGLAEQARPAGKWLTNQNKKNNNKKQNQSKKNNQQIIIIMYKKQKKNK